MLCTVCSLNAFVLFDESKEGEKLKNGKLIKIDQNWTRVEALKVESIIKSEIEPILLIWEHLYLCVVIILYVLLLETFFKFTSSSQVGI